MIDLIQDAPPFLGMNDVDNSKVLEIGECENLVNAMPGNPPKIRKGNIVHIIENTDQYEFSAPSIVFTTTSGEKRIITWFRQENSYTATLVSIPVDDISNFDILGVAQFDNYSTFGFNIVHDTVFCFISEEIKQWNSDAEYRGGNKVIEGDGITVRDMNLDIGDFASSHAVIETSDSSKQTFDEGDNFSYSFTFVRRTDDSAFESGITPTGMILPPGISGKPKTIDTVLPGAVESTTWQFNEDISITDNGTGKKYYIVLMLGSLTSNPDALYQGATHIRVWRTRVKTENDENLDGMTRFFVADVALTDTVSSYEDYISDDALGGQLVQLTAQNYTSSINAGYCTFAKVREWFAVNGKGYYSENVNGDGGFTSLPAEQNPLKWASMFNVGSQYVDLDSLDGQKSMGIARVGDDIIFFKETKTYSLFGGDPEIAVPEKISSTLGCAFPNTITECNVQGYFGECILFLSNLGPAIVQQGGQIRLFSEFKKKELWKDVSDELYGDLEDNADDVRSKCSAVFVDNNWVIMYKTSSGVFRWFNFFFDKSLASDNNSFKGAWVGEFAS